MHHRSHDREALDCTSAGPGSTEESGPTSLSSDDTTARTRIHEARNWLAVLRGHLDLFGERAADAPGRLEAARRALEAATAAL